MSSTGAADRAASLVGKTLAERYRLDAVLAAGVGTATFRATDVRGGTVALVLSYPEYLKGDAARRFLREAGALLMLRHPHVLDTLGSGTDPELGASFVARTIPEGRSVEAVLSEFGGLEPHAAVRVALQAARGLNAAHQIGVIHRGITPACIFLETRSDGELVVRVADFGCARLATDAGATPSGDEIPLPPGPPDYFAPEQLTASADADERVDLWGLGAVLYEMLSGSPPFGHLEEDGDVVLGIVRGDVPHIQDRAPWIAPELAIAVHRALARDPAQRFATLEDFAEALRPLAGGDELLTQAGVTTVPVSLRSRIATRADLSATAAAPPPVEIKTHDADELGLVGHRLAERFRVVRMIGKGGMGAVYEVEDTDGKRLAAKVIARGLATENHPALVRFAREAKASSAISSEHVVRTLDAGSDERLALPYIVMELLQGTDMSAVMKREGALDPQVAVRLVLQAARGIAAAHAQKVVHRDIKPANLFLQIDRATQNVTVKVCDFGVAKRARADESRRSVSQMSLTRTGGMLGSPMYMSPEQARNAKNVDGRADIWSLSVVLWEALTGRRLWGQQTSLGELIVSICTEPIPRVEEISPWVPRDLARIVHKALERDLSQRTASVQAFVAALELCAGGSDCVSVTDLAGLTDEQRLELVKKSAPGWSRAPVEPPAELLRLVLPAQPALQPSLPAPPQVFSQPHAAPLTNAPPSASSSSWLLAVIVAVLAAVTVTVVLLR